MHGYRENDFYSSEAEKAEFQKKLSQGYVILDKFILHLNNMSKQPLSCDVANDAKIQKMLDLSAALIGFIGEFAPAWSFRRWYLTQLLRQNAPVQVLEQSINREINLLTDTMLKYAKFYATWQHRLLLISQIACKLSASFYESVLAKEFVFIDKILAMDGRNFHCWRHINYLKQMTPNLTFQNKLTYPEYLTYLIKEDFSNFSAWHERALLDAFDTSEEIDMLHEAIYTDPEDSSIWEYYKHILTKYTPLRLLKTWRTGGSGGKSSVYLMFSDYVTRLKIAECDDSAGEYTYECVEGDALKTPSAYSRVWKITGEFKILTQVTIYAETYGKCTDVFYKRLVSTDAITSDNKVTHKFVINVNGVNEKNVVDFDKKIDQTIVISELNFIDQLLKIEPNSMYLHLAKIFILKHSRENCMNQITDCYYKLMQLDTARVNYYKHENSLSQITARLTEVSEHIDISGNYLSGIPYALSVKLFGCQSLNLSNCGLTCSTVDGWHIPLIRTLQILDISSNNLNSLDTLTTSVVLLDVRGNPLNALKSSPIFITEKNPNLKIIVADASNDGWDWAAYAGAEWLCTIANEALCTMTNLSPLLANYLTRLSGTQNLLIRQT